MNFLAPAFFAGLAALAVPVLIHLIRRERRTVVEFPSLMFLQRIPVRTMRQQQLRHLMLLLLRCAALALLVFAFARPFLRRNAAAALGSGATIRVVLVDRSWSMGAADRWARAKSAARDAVRGLGANDRAVVIAFAGDAASLTEPTGERAALERAIDSLKLSDQGTRYARAIKLAAEVLLRTNLPRREVVLISDFQRAGFSARDDVRLPPGTALRTVDVGGAPVADAALLAVSADRDETAERARVVVAARVRNGGPASRAIAATLAIGGRPVETKTVTVAPGGVMQVRFTPAPVPAGTARATVRLAPDALPADDAFHFTLAAAAAVPLLVIEPATPRARQSLYLERVLAIGDRPSFRVERRSVSALRPQDFDGKAVVVLNEASLRPGAVSDRLAQFVKSGGGLVVIPGVEDFTRNAPMQTDLMPARLGATVDRSAGGGTRVAEIAYTHPVFELFSAPHSGDFATGHVFRFREAAPVTGATVLARYDDGSPALVERVVGEGRVLLWTTSADDFWSDLPMNPVFLPFVHELMAHAARHQNARASYVVGDALDVARLSASTRSKTLVLQAPSGARTALGGTNASVAELGEAGFYELRAPGEAAGTGEPVAVNVDAAESDLTPMPTDEFVAAVTALPGERAAANGAALPVDAERDQSLWWYLVVAVLVLLVGETLWANRLSGVAG
jgi:hypothetical protein